MTLAAPSWSHGLSEYRVMTWSFAIHVGIVLAMFIVPREWLTRERVKPPMMTISLGSTGPKTTGTIPIGGRTVEQAAPPPKRPEPIRPAPKAPPAPTNVSPPRPPAGPTRSSKPSPPPSVPPPVTGPQVTQGSTPVDTGARGQGVGLASSGGVGGEDELRMDNFCCPDYLNHIKTTIEANWHKDLAAGRGTTVIRFAIMRSGAIAEVTVEQSSGGPLDRLARAALADSRLKPLPTEYTRERLIIHLNFPYGAP